MFVTSGTCFGVITNCTIENEMRLQTQLRNLKHMYTLDCKINYLKFFVRIKTVTQ